MKPTPDGWPRIAPSLSYRDAGAMIDWLCTAFGFVVRLKVDGDAGGVKHSELTYGDDGLVMVGSEKDGWDETAGPPRRSPASLGGANTGGLMVYVDDVDGHCTRSRSAGATIITEPADHDYGAEYWTDRSYGATDPEGHMWWFAQRVRDPTK